MSLSIVRVREGVGQAPGCTDTRIAPGSSFSPQGPGLGLEGRDKQGLVVARKDLWEGVKGQLEKRMREGGREGGGGGGGNKK